MKFILDTCVLISDEPPLPSDAQLAISVVSLAELHFGALVAKSDLERGRRLHRLSVIEHSFEAIPVTDEIARFHGTLSAQVKSSGRQPRARTMDLFIAATAVAVGAQLLTYNLTDFEGLEPFLQVARPARE